MFYKKFVTTHKFRLLTNSVKTILRADGVCGWIDQDLNLSVREWTCKNGHHLESEESAAKNILNEGSRIISARRVEYTGGDDVRNDTQLSAKPEACLHLANGQFTALQITSLKKLSLYHVAERIVCFKF